MIKLKIKGKEKEVEFLESSSCNFCGEESKECFKSTNPQTVPFCHLKDSKKLEWLRTPKMFSVEKLYWVIEPEYTITDQKVSATICKDCVTELLNNS